MKRLLAIFALSLFAACSVAAQTKPLLHRVGDAFSGPVRSARLEIARFSNQDGEMVEGPRVLTSILNYSPNGRWRETIVYQPDGSVRERDVDTYNEDGKQETSEAYDSAGALIRKRVYTYDMNGRLVEESLYKSDGTVQKKKFASLNDAGNGIPGTETYNANGTAIKREVNTLDPQNNRSVWTTYNPGGTRAQENIFSLNYGEQRRHEEIRYNTDGSIAGRRVVISDPDGRHSESIDYDAQGKIVAKEARTSEYDSHRNLVKQTNLKWNSSTEQLEPYYVSWATITYY